jgi:hypothetical protein
MWKNRHVFFANSHPVANISLLLACAKQAWKSTDFMELELLEISFKNALITHQIPKTLTWII